MEGEFVMINRLPDTRVGVDVEHKVEATDLPLGVRCHGLEVVADDPLGYLLGERLCE